MNASNIAALKRHAEIALALGAGSAEESTWSRWADSRIDGKTVVVSDADVAGFAVLDACEAERIAIVAEEQSGPAPLTQDERRARYRNRADEARRLWALTDPDQNSWLGRQQAWSCATAWDQAWYACQRPSVSLHEASLVAHAEAWDWCASLSADRSPILSSAVALARDYNLCSQDVDEPLLTRAIVNAVAIGASTLVALTTERPALERALRCWDEACGRRSSRYDDHAQDEEASVQTIGTLNIIDDGECLGLDDVPGVDKAASLLRFAAVVEEAVREALPEWRIGHVEIGPRAHALATQCGWDYDPRLDAHPHADTREVKALLHEVFAGVVTEPRYVDRWLVEATTEA